MIKFLKKPFLPLITYFGKRLEKKTFHKAPILIGGCARSGTTLLISILSSHPEIFACPRELGLFSELEKGPDGQPTPSRMDRLYRCLLFHKVPKSSSRWLEKSPNNIQHIEDIDRYFGGNFKFIHILRDGRDVVLSVHPTAKGRYWVEPERWVHDVSAGLAYADHPNVFLLKYEELVQQPEASIASLCAFLDIPLNDEIRNWQTHATVRRHNAYPNGLQSIQTSSVQKWKQKKHQQRVAEFMAYPGTESLLRQAGYL